MSINIISFNKLSELVSLSSLRKPKIVLNPDGEYYIKARKETRKRRGFKCKYNL